MNRIAAYKCLDLDLNEDIIDVDIIKKKYRIKALIYHPDKNKNQGASSKFQEIHDAYEYVMKEEGYMDTEDNNTEDVKNHNGPDESYRNLFLIFLKKILENETGESIFYSIIQRITTICESKAIELLERLDKTMLIKTHMILLKYKDAFHITDTMIEKIKELIQSRNENDECIILNPTWTDLCENNLYKLTVDNETYIIPLWHHELVYENNGHDIYVNCLPDLPSYITIDEYNHVHVDVKYNIAEIWNNEYIHVKCETKIFPIHVASLKITSVQTIIFVKQGISKMNTKNIYDITSKSDVHITIHLHM